MNGRLEHQQELKLKNKRKIMGAPVIVKSYYLRLTQCRSEVTKRQYLNQVLSFLDFIGGEKNIKFVDANTIAEYQEHMYEEHLRKQGQELKAITIRKNMCALSSFFNFCVKERILDSNPMDTYDKPLIPEEERRIISMDSEEISKLLNSIENGVGSQNAIQKQKQWKTRDRTIVQLALSTAIRVEALVEINLSDIDFYKAELKVIEKRAKPRTIHLGHDTIKQLKKWIREREELVGKNNLDALFITKYGGEYKRITVRAVQKMVKKYASVLDKKITPHKLRSTAGNILYEETGDIYAVADLLGHSNVSTSTYYATNSEQKRKNIAQKMSVFASGKS